MAFIDLPSFTKKVADLPDAPALTPADLKAQFDAAPDELRQKFNGLVAALKQTTSGDSGAKNVGATAISGLSGTDVQTLLESLKTFTDGKTNGAVFGKGSVSLNSGFQIFTISSWVTEMNADTFQQAANAANITFKKAGLYKVELSCTRSDLLANQQWTIGFSINDDAAKLITEKMVMGSTNWSQSGGPNLAQVPLHLSYFVRVNANDYINFNNNSDDGPRSYNMKFGVTKYSD